MCKSKSLSWFLSWIQNTCKIKIIAATLNLASLPIHNIKLLTWKYLISASHGDIVVWWSWLSAAVAICDYHVAMYIYILCSYIRTYADHMPKSQYKACWQHAQGLRYTKLLYSLQQRD